MVQGENVNWGREKLCCCFFLVALVALAYSSQLNLSRTGRTDLIPFHRLFASLLSHLHTEITPEGFF